MSLFISSLNSGSNGNCYYIGNENEAILVDAGISCRETELRMKRLGLDINKVKAIFISHEHSDHINGVPILSKKYNLPVFITPPTLSNSKLSIQKELVRSFLMEEKIRVGDLSIIAFPKSHDASDPHSFIVSGNDINIGVFTDIGYSCKEVLRYFPQCHAVFLESNYCEKMLAKGNYPAQLKRRIRGDEGHLSNDQALELFSRYRGHQLSHLILSHLSENNNDPSLVYKMFSPYAGPTKIVVASRYEETEVFHIQHSDSDLSQALPSPYYVPVSQVQLRLF